ncbi:restriction endonuclease subunit S [Mycoplasma sp. HS2188]|uniref:restriction endonuclease subunit S n=1 Tax=Mycoplasma sp. HS2188 TaxID=2976765 RepID=UPI0021AAAC74|nr:restriction endonuclease subunit S [Mycoplasma sp. HS2188]MCT4469942.1 restriction endonuclease subunit S [Mycoplasma sp. HS2188]
MSKFVQKTAKNFEIIQKTTNAWEQKRVDDLVSRVQKTTISINDLKTRGKYPVYSVNSFFGFNDKWYTKSDSVLISVDGSVGELFYLPAKNWFISTNSAIYSKDNIETRFLYYLLQNIDFSSLKKGTLIPHLYYSDYKNAMVFSCSKDEQKKISNLFLKTEDHISLLQCKLKIRQYIDFMNKFVEKTAENFEIIQKTANTWEQKRVGDIFSVYSGDFVPKWELNDNNKYPVYNGGMTFMGKSSKFNQEKNKIIISSRGAAGYTNIIKERFWAGNSVFSLDFKENKNLSLYFYYLDLKQILRKNYWISNSSTIPAILFNDLNSLNVWTTSKIEENKIGILFEGIKTSISLLQCNFVNYQN